MSRNLPLIDGHAHLDELENPEQDLLEAKRQGLLAIVGVGMSLTSNRKILAIAGENPRFVFPAIGYHPWEIKQPEIAENLTFIEENIDHCICIGEVGLDYKAKVKKKLQREVFREIVELSVRHEKILILHCRYSHQRAFAMITDGGVKKAVFHWYTGSLDLLKEIIASGYHISATPALAYSPPHQAAIREAPIERILLESDCPVSYRGHVSSPSDVRITAREVARIKGLSVESVAERTSHNTVEFFGLSIQGVKS
jgi:TatD DNase family protein